MKHHALYQDRRRFHGPALPVVALSGQAKPPPPPRRSRAFPWEGGERRAIVSSPREMLGQRLEHIARHRLWGALLLIERSGPEPFTPGDGLKRFSNLLRSRIRATDTFVYLGEGRFLLLIQEGMQPTAALNVARRLLRAFPSPAPGRKRVRPRLHIGIRIVGPEHEGAGKLLFEATQALARAQEQDGSGYHIHQRDDYAYFDIEATQSNGYLSL